LGTNSILVTIHGDTKPNKVWPNKNWNDFAALVLERNRNLYLADLGVRPIEFEEELPHDRILPLGMLPMSDAMAIVADSNYFIGVDSCFLHMADLCRIPGVGIFGPTDVHEFGFRFAKHRHVASRNLESIEGREVYDAFAQLQG
jgi:ADP-heptose:LPS heptosyltransferase